MPTSLIQLATRRFTLDIHEVHGLSHWLRVAALGAELARTTGADPAIVMHFAYLHDACRQDDWEDPDHGQRAADWVAELSLMGHIDVDGAALVLLHEAIRDHTAGRISDDPTIGTCWDADRLDLWRVGVTPAKRWLSTQAGKDLLEKQRSNQIQQSTVLDYL